MKKLSPELAVYNFDASQIEGFVEKVVIPKDVFSLVDFVKRHENITPRGAGTGLSGGAVPKEGAVVDMSQMNKIVKFEKAKGFVIVQAGIVLDDLNSELGNYFFPVIPASHSVCTIGGMIATNAVGTYSLRFGRTIDWVEELKIIDGAGKLRTINKSDIKDFCGREGTSGIIVEAKLKVAERPKVKSLDLKSFNTITGVIKEVKRLVSKNETLTLEMLDKLSAKILGLDERYYLISEYTDNSGSITNEEKMNYVRELREKLYPELSSKGYVRIEDPLLGLNYMPELFKFLESKNIPYFGHIGAGIIHPCFKVNSQELIDSMMELVTRLNGKVTGEHGFGLVKKKYVDKNLRKEIIELKKKYDSYRIMNRGKII